MLKNVSVSTFKSPSQNPIFWRNTKFSGTDFFDPVPFSQVKVTFLTYLDLSFSNLASKVSSGGPLIFDSPIFANFEFVLLFEEDGSLKLSYSVFGAHQWFEAFFLILLSVYYLDFGKFIFGLFWGKWPSEVKLLSIAESMHFEIYYEQMIWDFFSHSCISLLLGLREVHFWAFR